MWPPAQNSKPRDAHRSAARGFAASIFRYQVVPEIQRPMFALFPLIIPPLFLPPRSPPLLLPSSKVIGFGLFPLSALLVPIPTGHSFHYWIWVLGSVVFLVCLDGSVCWFVISCPFENLDLDADCLLFRDLPFDVIIGTLSGHRCFLGSLWFAFAWRDRKREAELEGSIDSLYMTMQMI